MEWYFAAAILFGTLIFFIIAGLHVAVAFGIVNIIGLVVFEGGTKALSVLTYSGYETVANFTFIALPLFLLIGNIVFCCGISGLMIDGVSKAMGGRRSSLYYVTVAASVVFGAVSGSSMAACAALGTVLVPEGEKRGYNTKLMLGLVAGGATLDVLIPPSGLMVVFGGISKLPVADLLIGGIVPGLVIAGLFVVYLAIRLRLDPKLLPPVEVWDITLRQRIAALRYVLPLGLIFVAVVGTIYLGVATPSEAAACGALASVVLAAFYRRLNWTNFRTAVTATVRTSGMILFILLGSKAFSEILAYTGASKGIVLAITGLALPHMAVLILMMVIILFLGCWMDALAIMFITVPVFFPVFEAFNYNLLWCGITMMVAIEIGALTPPFGLNIFVLKGIAPKGITLSDLYVAAVPFTALDTLGMFLVIAFPALATWLPGHMG